MTLVIRGHESHEDHFAYPMNGVNRGHPGKSDITGIVSPPSRRTIIMVDFWEEGKDGDH